MPYYVIATFGGFHNISVSTAQYSFYMHNIYGGIHIHMYVAVYSVLCGTLTCADPCIGRAGCSSCDTGFSLLVIIGKFDTTSSSFPVEISSELELFVVQLLFLGT